ncbi:hypothetical protein L1887_02953 [Cichorium endivia]|nr:hypothetical protein L1887_02953 [Cichorium endivia]
MLATALCLTQLHHRRRRRLLPSLPDQSPSLRRLIARYNAGIDVSGSFDGKDDLGVSFATGLESGGRNCLNRDSHSGRSLLKIVARESVHHVFDKMHKRNVASWSSLISTTCCSRLISACESHVSIELAGTFGYIPPEYGQSWRSTTKGDVYSFGVILLELVTEKEPTGPEFKDVEGGNLVGRVCYKIKKGQAVNGLDLTVVNDDCKATMLQTIQIPAVPPVILGMVKYNGGDYNLSSLRSVGSGAAPLSNFRSLIYA